MKAARFFRLGGVSLLLMLALSLPGEPTETAHAQQKPHHPGGKPLRWRSLGS
jgi:hypothetical protein